jgi:hypothetical protein
VAVGILVILAILHLLGKLEPLTPKKRMTSQEQRFGQNQEGFLSPLWHPKTPEGCFRQAGG